MGNIGMWMKEMMLRRFLPQKPPHKEEAEAETMDEDDGGRKAARRKMSMSVMRMGTRTVRAIAAQGPCRKVLTLHIATLNVLPPLPQYGQGK